MELIVISSPSSVASEAQHINDLFAAGLKCFHLRKPAYAQAQFTKLLDQIAPCFYDRIALHQFHALAPEFGIRRLHYPESFRERVAVSTLEAQQKKGLVLSTSIHEMSSLAQLKCFQYTFFGPVFNSISKPGYQSSLPEHFRLEKVKSDTRVYALGGIQTNNLHLLPEMNFDGAAVIGAVWHNPEAALSAFNELLKQLSKSHHD